MTKYSFKSVEKKSSVVVLKDGRVMELRRENKTCFAKGERQFWASLDEWKATLPAGAEVTVSGVREPVKPTGNPVLDRILAHGGQRRSTMHCVGTRRKILAANKEHCLSQLQRYSPVSPCYDHYKMQLPMIEKAIAETTVDNKIFRPSRNSRYFVQAEDGVFCEIHYSREDGVVGYYPKKPVRVYMYPSIEISFRDFHHCAKFVEVTDPAVPLWYFYGRKMVRI